MLKYLAGVGGLALVVFVLGAATMPAQAQQPQLTVRGQLPYVARDGAPDPADPRAGLPPADASYCQPSGGGSSGPPNSIFGFLRVGGAPAPAGTIVQVTFDGARGPAYRTREAGGYRVDYAAGGGDCANHVGAIMGVLVNGTVYATGVPVGDMAANPFLQFNIDVP